MAVLAVVGLQMLPAQTVVTLQATTSPGIAETGLTSVYVTGINFPSATIVPADVTVTLTPKAPSIGSVLEVSATAVQNLVGTSKRVTFLAPSIPISQPEIYTVTIADSTSGQAFTSGNSASLTIDPPAAVQSVTPNTGVVGTTVNVTIQGLYSNFFKGTSSVSAGPGIMVQSLTVVSTTVITAQFVIALNAVAGPRTVTVTTAAEVASLANAFTVSGTPALVSVNPNAGQQGQQNLSVTITGQFTHFAQGATIASLGVGITVASLTVNSAASVTAVVNIDPSVSLGTRNLTLTTNAEVVTLANAFTITAGNQAPVVSAGSNQIITLSASTSSGKIVVTNDEWQLSNQGFSATQSGSMQFALNVAQWFSGSSNQGSFLVYSTNFGLDPSQATTLASTMQGAGYTWTSYTAIPGFVFNLATLKSYQGVFLACPEIPDNNVLIDYVTSGGNVYLEGGTGDCDGGPDVEAETWNTFLNAFGLAFDGTGYNGVGGSIPIFNPLNSPVLNNVSALFEDNGNNILDLGSNPSAQIIDSYNGDGLYAVFYNPASSSSVTLNGTITDDGLPLGATLSGTWSETSGPGPVTFGTPTNIFADIAGHVNPINTTATFGLPGSYVLQLTGSDSLLSSISEVTITVLGPSTLLSVNPNAGQQGQQGLSVNIIGQFTNFVQGTTIATFGTGMRVASLTINSPTAATAVVNIDPGAPLGAHDVTITTGSEQAILSGGFTVTAASNQPPIVSAGPNQTVTLPTGVMQVTTRAALAAADFVDWGQLGPFVPAGSFPPLPSPLTTKSNTGNAVTLSGTFALEQQAPSTAYCNCWNGNFAPGDYLITNDTTAPGVGEPLTITFAAPVFGFGTQMGVDIVTPPPGVPFTGQAFLYDANGSQIAEITVSGAMDSSGDNSAVFIGARSTTPIKSVTFVTSPNPTFAINRVDLATSNEAAIVTLNGSITDDGLPAGASLNTTWSETSGPGPVSFSNPSATFPDVAGQVNSVTTSAAFNAPGTYILTLTGTDSQLSSNSQMTVTVNSPQIPALVTVAPNTGQQGQQSLPVNITGQFTNFVQGTTTATFGSGIMVSSVIVTSATSATAIVNIDPSAPVGASDVTFTTGSEIATLTGGFTVTATVFVPAITNISPDAGQQGQLNLTVNISGQFTHFVQGTSTVSFGTSDITANSVSVASPTSLTVQISISSGAALGPRTVSVTTGTEIASVSGGFVVSSGAIFITSNGTNSILEYNALTGAFITTFVPSGSGGMTSPETAIFGPDGNLYVDTSWGAVLRYNGQTGAFIDTFVPAGTGSLIGFGGMTFGPNGNLYVGADISGNINEYDATTGTFITSFPLQNGGFIFGPDGNLYAGGGNVGVNVGVREYDGTTGVLLRTFPLSSDPAATEPSGLAFGPDGNLYVGSAGVCCPQVSGEIVKYNPATTALLGVFVPPSSVLGEVGEIAFRPDGYFYVAGENNSNSILRYDATTGAFVDVFIPAGSGGLNQPFSMAWGPATAPSPAIISLNPSTGQQGQQGLSVSIIGQLTNFVQGTTTATFGAGITVTSLTISSANTATAVLTIDPAAPVGAGAVTLTTGSEVATLSGAFAVTAAAAAPAITAVSPNAGQQGQGGPVGIAGQNTHFSQDTTQVSFGPGITVSNIRVTCPTCLTAQLQISPTATPGPVTVTVTTGSEVATLVNGFTIQPGTPTITSFGPTSGQQGQTLTLTVNGQYTHFAQGTTQLSLGTGLTFSNIIVSSPTSLTGQLTIASNAAATTYTLTVTTGSEVISVPNVFNVLPTVTGTPTLLSLGPGGGQQGQTNLPVIITGQATNFVQGTSVASFGAGVTVVSLSVSSSTTATAVVNIDPAATVGTRTVTVTTGAELPHSLMGSRSRRERPRSSR